MKWVVLVLNILTIGILGYTVYMQYVELSYYRNLESEAIASYKPPEQAVKTDVANGADSEMVSAETVSTAEAAEVDATDTPDSESAAESSEAETLSVPADEEA